MGKSKIKSNLKILLNGHIRRNFDQKSLFKNGENNQTISLEMNTFKSVYLF